MDESASGERWLPVVDYEGKYEVSSVGRVRSVDRVVTDSRGVDRRLRGKMLKLVVPRDDPRPVVNIDYKARRVCHLVAEAFIGPRPTGMLVRHENDAPSDNRACNLSYGTVADNSQDAIRNGRNPRLNKTACPRNHLLVEPNLRPEVAAEGHRGCLACSNAGARVRHNPELDLVQTADALYSRIMGMPDTGYLPEYVHHMAKRKSCPRNHPLQAPNLRRMTASHKGRSCLACHRASAYIQNHPGYDLQAVSDRYYEDILRKATA